MKSNAWTRSGNLGIDFTAYVKARGLCFEESPDPEVRFGGTERDSILRTKRTSLPPQKVREVVTHRDARTRLRIASESAGGEPDLWKRRKEER